MNNNNNLKIKNPRKTRDIQRNLCAEEESKLHLEKAELGYSELEIKDFINIKPSPEIDQIKASKLISLQERFRDLQENKELLCIENKVVEELNLLHAIVHLDQTYILTEKKDLFGRDSFVLESKQSFKNFYENKQVLCYDGNERSKADIWLKNEFRREFINGIVFNPKVIGNVNGSYNIWKGFTKEPKQGDCFKFWDHVKDNICSKNENHYQYVRKWIASVFQKPDEVHTVLVLCGSQGVGKNSFVNPLGKLLGQHYAPLGSISELVSNFNFHLKNAVLIHANEAFWGGHKKERGILKAMITEETCLIESKGKDRIEVRNYKHVILSSNENWPVSLDPDDRRFFILFVSEEHKEDHAYFKEIEDQLNNGGLEALLYDLLNEPITGYNLRTLPYSKGSFDIKLLSVESSFIYLFESLREGAFNLSLTDINQLQTQGIWQSEIPKSAVFQDYKGWCEDNNYEIVASNTFGKDLKKAIKSISEKRKGSNNMRTWVYVFPDLKKSREEFCKYFKQDEEIWEENNS